MCSRLSGCLTPPNSFLDMLRAGLEAVAYRLKLIFDLLQPWLTNDCQVVASGRALFSSPTWLQIIADVLGRPLVGSRVREASARGAALLALAALRVLEDLGETPPFLGTVIEPDAGRHVRYCEAQERQQALYEKLI
jgi:gluconokinase